MRATNQAEIEDIEHMARQIRLDVLDMVYARQSGHLGGSLSAADIMACLYSRQLRLRPDDPKWPARDRFLLSKGHAAPALYSALSLKGFFSRDVLSSFRDLDSLLQGHPDAKRTPGVEMGAGPLGHGIGVGVGMALAAHLDALGYRVYVLLGDGELQAGIVWEGIMAAAKWGLNNLIAIVDNNGVQLDGPVAEIMPIEPLAAKWGDFGWQVFETDGHDVRSLLGTFAQAVRVEHRPVAIIAHTVKGKGVSFMEGQAAWHGKAPSKEEYELARKELEV